MLSVVGWVRIFLFAFFLVLLCFCISAKSFKSGNTVNFKYLIQVLGPIFWVPNWSEYTFMPFISSFG